MTKREFKTLQEVNEVIRLDKPEIVQKLFWKMFKDGEAYKNALELFTKRYNDEYEELLNNPSTVVCDKKEDILDEEGNKTGEELIPNEEIPEEELQNYTLIPSLELYLEDKDVIYPEWDNTLENEFKDFIMPNVLNKINVERDELTENITIELDSGEILQGDEKSQERMSRTLAVIGDNTINWIGANNDIYELTKEKLEEALFKAGQKQTDIFIEYATKKAEVQA